MNKHAEDTRKEMEIADEFMKNERKNRMLISENLIYGKQLNKFPQRPKNLSKDIEKELDE